MSEDSFLGPTCLQDGIPQVLYLDASCNDLLFLFCCCSSLYILPVSKYFFFCKLGANKYDLFLFILAGEVKLYCILWQPSSKDALGSWKFLVARHMEEVGTRNWLLKFGLSVCKESGGSGMHIKRE